MLSLFMDRPAKESLSGDPFDDRYYKVDPGTGYAYLRPDSIGAGVNESVAMTYSACWAATMLLCSAISMIPLKLFRKLPGGGSEVVSDDLRYSMVHDAPNMDMTSMMFRSSRTAQQINWGNGYAEIERNRGGMPIALHPIHASRIPDRNIKRINGRLTYLVNSDNGSQRELRAENILHIPSPMSDDGIIGKGVVSAARRSIGLGIATEKHGGAYFGNSARPGIIIKGGKFRKAEDIEEFRRQWGEIHGGPDNNAKPAILPPDADVTTLQFNAQDSQFLETRQFSIDDIARWYGIPPHTIGSLMRATDNNIEQLALELTKYSLMRWTVPQEQEMNKKLLTAEERKTMFFLHIFEGLERADIKTRTDALKEQFFNGEITLNEWRALENRSPIGPLGDLHFVQSAMVPLEIAAKGPQRTQVDGSDNATETEELKQRMESYGIGVRAGAITPQLSDEDQFRASVGLPPMSDDTKKAWEEDKGFRRPITLRDPNTPTTPFGQPRQPPADEPKEEPTDDGELSRLVDEVEHLKRQLSETTKANGHAKQYEQMAATQQKIASALLRDTLARMLSIEIHSVKHIAEKPNRFDTRLREFYDKHTATMSRSLTEPVTVWLAANNDERAPADVVMTMTSGHIEESLKQLDALCDCKTDELSGRVERCVEAWREERVVLQ